MDREDFGRAIMKLFNYFQRKLPLSETVDDWFQAVSYIETSALPFILVRIQDYDSFPKNIPKAFRYEYRQSSKESGDKKYDPIEDLSFPVKYLYDAHEVLETEGNQAFIGFCDKVRMPQTDRERVLNKHNKLFDMGKLKKMLEQIGQPIPDLPTELDKINETKRQKRELLKANPPKKKEEGLGDNKEFNEDDIPF